MSSLPKIEAPVFELIQPSTQKKLRYHSFRGKEEKLLLTAKESEDRSDVINAVKAVINNCVLDEEFNVDDIPIFDMEYIFIQMRANSVDNIVEFTVEDSMDGQTYDLSIDLNEVQVIFPEDHERDVELPGGLTLRLKYPTPAISDKLKNLGDDANMSSITFEVIEACVDMIFNEDEVFSWDVASDREKEELLETIPSKGIRAIQRFFKTMPKIHHEVEYKNSMGNTRRVVFRTLDDFFILY